MSRYFQTHEGNLYDIDPKGRLVILYTIDETGMMQPLRDTK